MPYAVLEKEIERLDEKQQDAVVLFVRFLLSQKASTSPVVHSGARSRRYDFSRVAGRLKLREDPVAFQGRIRDEW